MYKYFFNITLRSLTKRGVFQIINILGLSIGLSVVLLISLLIFNEQSFDKSFKECGNIYRVNSKLTAYMPGETFATTANQLGPTMQEAIPEVIAAVRTHPWGYDARINDTPLRIRIMWADEDFFRLFDTPFLHGSPETVMSRPNAIAVSEEMGKTLFGNDNPMGKTFMLNSQHLVEVVAVYQDYPKNSSFREHKIIAPMKHAYESVMTELQWGNLDFETFFLLPEKADTASVNTQMRKTLLDVTEGMWSEHGFYWPVLQRLDKIHLYSANFYAHGHTSSQSDIGKVKMLLLLAVIILLVACINYMNLSTARAQKRSKEIGVSKTLGAKRIDLINRLFLETGILTFISFAVAFLLTALLLPVFNSLLDEQISFELALQPLFLSVAVIIWIATTLLAASYPALYMSGFPPLMAISQSKFTVKSSHAVVRKVLTVGQFAVAVVLIAWVLIIQSQISFMNNKDLGYNPRNLVAFRLFADPVAMANDFRMESSVEMVARVSTAFLYNGSGNVLEKNADDKMGYPLTTIATDPEYIDVLQIKLLAGRRLPEERADSITQILLNRAAVEYLGMTPEEVIGKRVLAEIGVGITEVCGVVENFNYESLHTPIKGYCMHNNPTRAGKWVLTLRVKEGNLSEQLKTYEQIFKKHAPNENFDPVFIESDVASEYDIERRTGLIAVVFSLLAILVACMGVFGLTAFMAEQRTKEIGIRKVMGASIGSIVSLFTNSYVKLLLTSLVIAIPVAWWVGHQYLQGFAYRISISWWIFAAAALITVALTLITVSALAIKASMANPVKSLKTE